MTRTTDDKLLAAARLYEQGEHEFAIEQLNLLLKEEESAAAYHLRARCYRCLGDNQAALADLNLSLQMEPNNPQGYRERAQLHFLAKQSDLVLLDNQLAAKYAGDEERNLFPTEEDRDFGDPDSYRQVEEGSDDDEEEDEDEKEGEDSEADELFDRVYEAREAFFEDHFGIMPPDVLKLNNMMGVWPGGCLVQIDATELPDEPCVTATFGLTNPDMPASVRSEDVVHEERTEGDKLLRSTSMRLVARDRVQLPPGLAGYGYEILVITPEQYDWPTLFLSWFVTNEINHDTGWLQRVEQDGAIVVKTPLRDYPRLKMLIAKAAPPIPESFNLPNGKAHLLVATSITEAEYVYATTAGAPAVLECMLKHGPGQTSIIFRPSCLR